jgi:hypothetical protein
MSHKPKSDKPEVNRLLERGAVTLEDIKDLRCNSSEWRALQLAMTDEAFLDRMRYAMLNSSINARLTTYDDSVIGHFAPELIRRFEAATKLADAVKRWRRYGVDSRLLEALVEYEHRGIGK